MRRSEVKGTDGRVTVRLLPETEEDVEYLRRLAEQGAVNDAASFGDFEIPTPSVPSSENQHKM